MSIGLQDRPQLISAPRRADRRVAPRAMPRASAGHPPPATVADRPVEAPPARWLLILGRLVAMLREWRRRTTARRELANFDTRMLRDVGVDPGMVDYEMRQPFWRPLRDWRG